MAECGHLPSLRAYAALDIDRRPEVLTQWTNDVADGSPVGEGWFEVEVPHFHPHGISGRPIPQRSASLANLSKEARAESVRGQCQEFDRPISHTSSLNELLRNNGLLETAPLLVRYCDNYSSWRQQWGKAPLTSLGYGDIPPGPAWNPITWAFQSEVRVATIKLLDLPQNAYLQDRFAERKHPVRTRLYYAKAAHEFRHMMDALNRWSAHFPVRGLIYNSILPEGTMKELEERHALVEKPLVLWTDNLFMVLRAKGTRGNELVLKIKSKNLCIANSCLNVGNAKVLKAIQGLRGPGLMSYSKIQRFLVSRKTGQYLELAGFNEVESAGEGAAFLLHSAGHSAGVRFCEGDPVRIAGPSNSTQVTMSASLFRQTLRDFSNAHEESDTNFFRLKIGQYGPKAEPPAFLLVAGVGGPKSSQPSYRDELSRCRDSEELLPVFRPTTTSCIFPHCLKSVQAKKRQERESPNVEWELLGVHSSCPWQVSGVRCHIPVDFCASRLEQVKHNHARGFQWHFCGYDHACD